MTAFISLALLVMALAVGLVLGCALFELKLWVEHCRRRHQELGDIDAIANLKRNHIQSLEQEMIEANRRAVETVRGNLARAKSDQCSYTCSKVVR